jgi:type VI secretion system protein ImpH
VAAENQEEDRLRGHLNDLAGFGTPAVLAAAGTLAPSLPFYSGLLGLRTRPAAGLAQIIADYFAVPVTVEQFVGEWRMVKDEGQLCLGDEGMDGMLGNAVIGNAIYDPHARVRLRLGPLTRAQFDDFLPTGKAYGELQKLARLYTDDQVGVDAQLVLRRDDVPGVTLGSPMAANLGFGTWLRHKPIDHDADDVHLMLC